MDYSWALNKTKLAQSKHYLAEQKKINPSLVIDEASIKAEYIRRAGLVDEPLKPKPAAVKVVPLRMQSVEELEAIATAKGIDISEIKTKSALVKAIEGAK